MHMVLIIFALSGKLLSFAFYTVHSCLVSLVYLRFGTFEESLLAFKHVCPLATCAHRMGNNLKQIDV